MIKHFLVVLAFFMIDFFVSAQTNLVPNPSFELKNSCRLDSLWGIDTMWFDNPEAFKKAQSWCSPNYDSPDYYNNCQNDGSNCLTPANMAGSQYPKSGNAYCGIAATWRNPWTPIENGEGREYLQTKLIKKTENAAIYCGRYFASPTFRAGEDYHFFAIGNLAIALTVNPPHNTANSRSIDPNSHTTIFLTPQIEYTGQIVRDTGIWFPVEGLYKSNGQEQWLTIGNFRTFQNTDTAILYRGTIAESTQQSYYYIDDVSLTKVSDPIFSSHDTAVCAFPLQLTAISGFDHYKWNTGDTTQTVTINQPGQYWVRVEMGECGSVSDTIEVRLAPILSLNIEDKIVCPSELPLLVEAPPGFDSYLWNTGDTTSIIIIAQAGKYSVSATSACEALLDDFEIELKEIVPVFDLGGLKNICEDYIIVPASVSPTVPLPNYAWSTGETAPTITVDRPGIYWLASKTDCNNWADTIKVEGCPTRIYVPNIFSPNGDGQNDVFTVLGTGFDKGRLSVFDRWGELVFEGNIDGEIGWDGTFRGKPMPAGVYAYLINYQEPFSNNQISLSGNVTLIR